MKKIQVMEKNSNNKKLKIGILSFYYPHLGGSGIITTRLAKHLARKGHEIYFIGYDTDENPDDMENLGIELHRVRKVDYPCLHGEPYAWSLASRAVKIYTEKGLDLIHANYAVPHALSAFAAREQLKKKGKYLPYIVTGHGSDIHTNGAKEDVNPVLQLCLNSADALTFVSTDLQKIAKSLLGVTKESIHIPNFVDPKEFFKEKTDYREKLKIPKNAFVIGHVSNFAPIKQVYHFGYLAQHLISDGLLSNFYFIMCGDGKDRADLEERVRVVGAQNNFKFVGKLNPEELRKAYNAMDTIVLTSRHEGNPLVLLEAMACQKPVIGTNVGGIREVISENVGLLFESGTGSARRLTEKILILRNNPSLAARFGKKGLKKVEKENSVEMVIDEYLKVYNSVLKEK